jgi:Na+-transporting methylmalonyl-CoA/oxaloacetate decarboxylase gamma subunit
MPFVYLADMTLAERLRDALTVTIVGMGTVFVSLYLMGELFTLLHRYFHGKAARGEPETTDIVTSAAQPTSDPHLVHVIVAAATAALGRRVAVRRITFISRNTVSGWGEAGRASIQTSHNLRRTM